MLSDCSAYIGEWAWVCCPTPPSDSQCPFPVAIPCTLDEGMVSHSENNTESNTISH